MESKILRVFEEAVATAKARKHGAWVNWEEIQAKASRRYSARIKDLRDKGFRIEGSQIPKKSRNWYFKLDAYPDVWKDRRVFQADQMSLFAA